MHGAGFTTEHGLEITKVRTEGVHFEFTSDLNEPADIKTEFSYILTITIFWRFQPYIPLY
jgi:hypothetical protein